MKSAFLILTIYAFIPIQTLYAQGEVSIGADTVTRYLWRGVQFDNGINFQPYMMYNISNFEAGVSSSMSLTNDFNEIYFWAAYSVTISSLRMKFYISDFYYETEGSDFFNFKTERINGTEGDHYGEAHVIFSSDRSPVEFLFSTSFRNDPDNSMYAEVSYSKTLSNDIQSVFLLGGSLNESNHWYFTNKASLVNVSYELSKSIQITPEYAIPFSVKSTLNPNSKNFYVVLGISI